MTSRSSCGAASGSTSTTARGTQYLDFFGGIATVSSGHAIPEINDPVKEQLDRIIHSSTLFLIRSQIELAERLRAMTPPRLNKVFFTNSGTEANEAAFLITTLNRQSNELIALRHSYHGRSFATINASGQTPWRSSTLSPLHVHYVGNPYCYRCPWEKTYPDCGLLCARDVEAVIRTTTSGQPAAFVAEPVQGVGGFITPPPEYFIQVKEILDRYGIPFISDEVQTAWGRLGVADWGFQAYGVEPDVVVFAKGLANGVPIGGVIATDELAGAIRSLSLSTFGGNPVATTAAMANLNFIATHNLRENARRVGDYLMARLRRAGRAASGHRRCARDGVDGRRGAGSRSGDEGAGAGRSGSRAERGKATAGSSSAAAGCTPTSSASARP